MKWQQLTEKGDTAKAYEVGDFDIETLLEKYGSVIEPIAKGKQTIYRGMKSIGPFGFGDGNKMNRQSKNTENYYTLIMDNDPSWEEYPKRSKSFICSTEYSYASAFGVPYVVIPLENQEIGVCPSMDFWESFVNFPASINRMISDLARFYLKRPISQTNYNEFHNDLNDISKSIPLDPHVVAVKDFEEMGYNIGDSLYDFYVKLIDPRKNNFKITTDISSIPDDREVWLSGKVLFIQMIEWRKIKKYYEDAAL